MSGTKLVNSGWLCSNYAGIILENFKYAGKYKKNLLANRCSYSVKIFTGLLYRAVRYWKLLFLCWRHNADRFNENLESTMPYKGKFSKLQ